MESLRRNLQDVHARRACARAWAAFDATQFILNQFRERATAGMLSLSDGPTPHYFFDPQALSLPPDAAFAVADAARYKDAIIDMLQEATGLRVSWDAPTEPIRLHLPGEVLPRGERFPTPKCVLSMANASERAPARNSGPATGAPAAGPGKARPDNIGSDLFETFLSGMSHTLCDNPIPGPAEPPRAGSEEKSAASNVPGVPEISRVACDAPTAAPVGVAAPEAVAPVAVTAVPAAAVP